MLCQECGKHEATVHFTQMVQNEKKEMKICKNCAAKKGFQSSTGTVENIVSKIMSGSSGTKSEEDDVLVCRSCGTTYGQFQSSGRLGCSDCYTAFEKRLEDLLRKIHGSIHHTGKSPARVHQPTLSHELRIQELREQLRKAVQAEQFEEAALLRDEIKRLEEAIP